MVSSTGSTSLRVRHDGRDQGLSILLSSPCKKAHDLLLDGQRIPYRSTGSDLPLGGPLIRPSEFGLTLFRDRRWALGDLRRTEALDRRVA